MSSLYERRIKKKFDRVKKIRNRGKLRSTSFGVVITSNDIAS